ncbi:MAG: restriction endonuclease, partial [bacterium]
ASVSFPTRKQAIPTTWSHVSHVVLDGPKGNTWEEEVAGLLEAHPDVHAYVKNDHLGFGVPYVHKGRSHTYVPDFLVRLKELEDDDTDRTLIIEVSGGRKSPGPTAAKADTTRDLWCSAVNNHGGWGRWDYLEIKDMTYAKQLVDDAIDEMLMRTAVSLR